jgi:hypothetical protein
MTGFATRVTRRVPLSDQELPTLSEHLSSPSGFSGVRVSQSLVLSVMFFRSVFFSDYPFDIFKLVFAQSVSMKRQVSLRIVVSVS